MKCNNSSDYFEHESIEVYKDLLLDVCNIETCINFADAHRRDESIKELKEKLKKLIGPYIVGFDIEVSHIEVNNEKKVRVIGIHGPKKEDLPTHYFTHYPAMYLDSDGTRLINEKEVEYTQLELGKEYDMISFNESMRLIRMCNVSIDTINKYKIYD